MKNTCGFDSVVSVYGALHIDYSIMRDKIDKSTSKFAGIVKSLFQNKKIDSKIEYARYQFLREISTEKNAIKELKNFVSFDCKTGISGLFSSMCKDNSDVLSSRERIEKCSSCGNEKRTESPFANFLYDDFDFEAVQLSIVPERIRVCDACLKKTSVIEDEFHDVVVIDCEPLLECQRKRTTISSIQKQIHLNENEYELLATVQFEPEPDHFIAHIKRKNNEWETYNDLDQTRAHTNTNEEMFIFLLFYKKKSNGTHACACLFVIKFA